MSAEVSFTKRAAAELSRCFNGISVSRQSKSKNTNLDQTCSSTSKDGSHKPLISETTQLINNKISGQKQTCNKNSNTAKIVIKHGLNTPTSTPRRGSRNGQIPPQAPPKTSRARRKNYLLSLQKAKYLDELWTDPNFLAKFFTYFLPLERCVIAQVCKTWQAVLYSAPRFWKNIIPVILCNELRREKSLTLLEPTINGENMSNMTQDLSTTMAFNEGMEEIKLNLYDSIEKRGFDSICLFGATDGDIVDFTSKMPPNLLKRFTTASLRNASISDKGLEIFLASLSHSLTKLELSGCNEISDSGLWTGMVSNLETLIILDCINIADETIAAICQMLPNLKKLQIQAYHVTDTSMAYFGSTCARDNLRVLMLHHCWELTNQGVASLSHGLPNLHSLSLSGCSKVSDDAIEVIAEQIRGLRYLDLSWCPRVSDAALEYIACDLSDTLNHLVLDRCLHITDIGLGYVATMTNLYHLSLRWCPQVRDFGLQTLCSMRSLRSLSIAGCPQLTLNGLSCIVQMQQLSELELTNCPAATKELMKYLRENLPPNCSIII